MAHPHRIPTADLPKVNHAAAAAATATRRRREPLGPPDQAVIGMPRGKGWRYRWRFFDGTASAWRDAPDDRSFVYMPPAATGLDLERPDLRTAANIAKAAKATLEEIIRVV